MRRKNILILSFLFGICMEFFSQQGAYYQQFAKYKMEIDVQAEEGKYTGVQQISYTNNSPDELRILYFHLYWNAFRKGSAMDDDIRDKGRDADRRMLKNGISLMEGITPEDEGGQYIKEIKQNGKNLAFEVQGTILKVFLDKPLKANSSTNLSMQWTASIPKMIRRAGKNSDEGVDLTMTQWYPKVAHYGYEGWEISEYIGREFHSSFADYDIQISIDKKYVLGAGGILQNPHQVNGYVKGASPKIDERGKILWKWEAKNILDFAWVADPDFVVESQAVLDGPKLYWVYQKNEKTEAFWNQSKPYVEKFFQIMNNTIGRYVYPTYTFMQGGDGGMEYSMGTIIIAEHQRLEDLVMLMIHEAAHSWFQDILATNETKYHWLDEGFTTYIQDYMMYKLFPSSDSHPFYRPLKKYRDFIKNKGLEEPAAWHSNDYTTDNAYSIAAYTKGELFLVQLGYLVGEKNLDKILRRYYQDWALKHPTPMDFMHIAQRESEMDLSWFYHYWINTTKKIDYAIKSVEYQEDKVFITLENKGQVPMPIDFSILTSENKIVNYQIPTSLTRAVKKEDIYGEFTTLSPWVWTKKRYTLVLPFQKSQIKKMGIDFSKRLADIHPEDNFLEVK